MGESGLPKRETLFEVKLTGMPTDLTDRRNTMNTTLEQRIQRLEDQTAIKHLVDTFSNLADDKDVASQMPLFTEDAR